MIARLLPPRAQPRRGRSIRGSSLRPRLGPPPEPLGRLGRNEPKVNAGGKPHFRDTLNRTEASDGWNPGSLAMLAAKRLASSRVKRCAAARRPGCSSKYTWAHKKDAGFRKTRVESLAWCRRCFWGSPLACDPSQRKCAPATVDESLLARTIQAKDDAGWVARVVWGGVGWGFQR